MRYADISGPTGIGSIPDVPSLPAGVRTGSYRSGSVDERGFTEEPKEDPKAAELKLLDKDDFDPDACTYDCSPYTSNDARRTAT